MQLLLYLLLSVTSVMSRLSTITASDVIQVLTRDTATIVLDGILLLACLALLGKNELLVLLSFSIANSSTGCGLEV